VRDRRVEKQKQTEVGGRRSEGGKGREGKEWEVRE
jgi:hypothetical protein